jgi:hypothetical protein
MARFSKQSLHRSEPVFRRCGTNGQQAYLEFYTTRKRNSNDFIPVFGVKLFNRANAIYLQRHLTPEVEIESTLAVFGT